MDTPPEYYVDNMRDLNHVLSTIGPPARGTQRVFRGQTREYLREDGRPLLGPSASRSAFRETLDPGWTYVSTILAAALSLPQGLGSNDTFVWVPALLQHYGFGSRYVDVSADPVVALWFALHKRHEHVLERNILLDKSMALPEHSTVAWYSPLSTDHISEALPVLYVFDAKRWNPDSLLPNQGDLVDLFSRECPLSLSGTATRLRAQKACLLFCVNHDTARSWKRLDADNQDIFFAVRAVIRLRNGIVRTPPGEVTHSVHTLFPDAASDPMLRVLTELPHRMLCGPIRLETALALPRYVEASSAEAAIDSETETLQPLDTPHLDPILFLHRLVQDDSSLESDAVALRLGGREYHVSDALPVALETALWGVSPQIESGWIQAVLPLCIADKIAGYFTDNVYVELSSADMAFRGTGFIPRGIWLIRQNQNYIVTSFGTGPGSLAYVRVHFQYERGTGRFVQTEFQSAGLEVADPSKADTPGFEPMRSLFCCLDAPQRYVPWAQATSLPRPWD